MNEPPPVFDKDFGAILPDGTHIPAEAIARAVALIEQCCNALARLTPEQRAGMSVAGLFEGLEEG